MSVSDGRGTPLAVKSTTPGSPVLLGVDVSPRAMSPFDLSSSPPELDEGQGSLELSPLRFVPPLPPLTPEASGSVPSVTRVPELTREGTTTTESAGVETITEGMASYDIASHDTGVEGEDVVPTLAEVETTFDTTHMNQVRLSHNSVSSLSLFLELDTKHTSRPCNSSNHSLLGGCYR